MLTLLAGLGIYFGSLLVIIGCEAGGRWLAAVARRFRGD